MGTERNHFREFFRFVAISGLLLSISLGRESKNIKPGGLWVTPENGTLITGMIHLLARAYPTNVDDPPITKVLFTASINGGDWQTICEEDRPEYDNVYDCVFGPLNNGVATLSFDVYAGAEVNYAPHGTRTVIINKP